MKLLRRSRLWFLAGLWLISAVAAWWFVPPVPKLEIVGRPAGFSDDGSVYLVLQDDGKAHFYDPETAEELTADRQQQLAGNLSGLDFPCSSDGRVWVQQHFDQWGRATLTICDLAKAKKVATLEQGMSRAYALSPDGTRLIYFNGQGQRLLCEITTGQTLATIAEHAMAFSPDGTMIATVGPIDGKWTRITLWDAQTGAERKQFAGHLSPQYPQSLSFSSNGKLLASGCTQPHMRGQPAEVKIWDIATGEAHAAIDHPWDAGRIHFAPGGEILKISSRLQFLCDYYSLWDVSQTPPRALVDGKADFLHQRTSDISPDGKTLAYLRGGEVEFLSLPGLEQRQQVPAGRGFHIRFSPDSTRLALLSGDQIRPAVSIVDVPNGESIGAWRLPLGAVQELELSSGGKTLMTSAYTRIGKSWDDWEDRRTIRLWDIPPQRPVLTIGLIWLGTAILYAGIYVMLNLF